MVIMQVFGDKTDFVYSFFKKKKSTTTTLTAAAVVA